MDAGGARWAEHRHYAAPPDHLQHPNLLHLPHPHSHSHSHSYYHYPSGAPNPNPNPNPSPIPATGALAPAATESYLPNSYPGSAWHEEHHGGVESSLQPASSYYYAAPPVGAGGGHDVALKEAVRQYGVDPALYGNALAGSSNGLPRSFQPHARPVHQNFRVVHPAMKRLKKKPSKGPAKVAQPVSCEVCKIKCSSEEDLKSHRQGKKHKSNLQKLQESIAPKPSKPPKTTTSTPPATSVMGTTAMMATTSFTPTTSTAPSPSVTAAAPATSTTAATSTTSTEKKESSTDDKGKPLGERMRKMPVPASVEDLELKKQNVLKAGVAESEIRICTLCNVVVNSPLIFNNHITGQKHLAMVRKWQAAQSIMQQMDDLVPS